MNNGATGGASGKKLWLNGIELDLPCRCLRRDGEEVPLRAKTLDLLLYLIEHRFRVVPKSELLQNLWGDTPVTMDALVQSVLDLRRSLGDSARSPKFIETVAKAGYRFIGEVTETGPSLTTPAPAEPAARQRRWMTIAGVAAVLALAVLALGISKQVPTEAADSWEAAWWKLDEGSGSRIADSIHGMAADLPTGVSWTDGISGSAIRFTRHDVRVHGEDPGFMPRGATPRTLVAWLKSPDASLDSALIFYYGHTSPQVNFDQFGLLLHENGKAIFGSPHQWISGTQRIDDGEWHQVAGVFDGAEKRTMHLYVDGSEQASAAVSAPPLLANTEAKWAMGAGIDSGTTFQGAIDDVRVYGRALRGDEVQALSRCMNDAHDLAVPDRGNFYFVPVHGNYVTIKPAEGGESSARVTNSGMDFSGIMLARHSAGCPLESILGADVGQNLNISMDVRVPLGASNAITNAGPFFRSRRAHPGDGTMGGASSGFWVDLDSTGRVRVQRLNPSAVVAFSKPLNSFDASRFHHLEVTVHGDRVEVALDHNPVTLEGDRVLSEVNPANVTNGGSAGIVFACPHNRGQAGGQEARNISVRTIRDDQARNQHGSRRNHRLAGARHEGPG